MIQVIEGADVSEQAFEKYDYLGKGCKLMNSEEFTGLTVEEAKTAITDKLVKMGVARKKANYHSVSGFCKTEILGRAGSCCTP